MHRIIVGKCRTISLTRIENSSLIVSLRIARLRVIPDAGVHYALDGLATPAQVKDMMPLLQDTAKFSTYIPFPTVAADNPKYNPRGYWRGPIWLDQTYFAISGLRNYGYDELADSYTRQVFNRLDGLKEGAPIHENYDTHTVRALRLHTSAGVHRILSCSIRSIQVNDILSSAFILPTHENSFIFVSRYFIACVYII